MTHAEYLAYLQSPAWKRKRSQVLRRDDRRCVLCHSTDRLEVHHASYARLGHEALTDLVTLCHECHERISLGFVERAIKYLCELCRKPRPVGQCATCQAEKMRRYDRMD